MTYRFLSLSTTLLFCATTGCFAAVGADADPDNTSIGAANSCPAKDDYFGKECTPPDEGEESGDTFICTESDFCSLDGSLAHQLKCLPNEDGDGYSWQGWLCVSQENGCDCAAGEASDADESCPDGPGPFTCDYDDGDDNGVAYCGGTCRACDCSDTGKDWCADEIEERDCGSKQCPDGPGPFSCDYGEGEDNGVVYCEGTCRACDCSDTGKDWCADEIEELDCDGDEEPQPVDECNTDCCVDGNVCNNYPDSTCGGKCAPVCDPDGNGSYAEPADESNWINGYNICN